MKVPAQYQPLMPYLVLNRAAEFRHFMAQVFNATEQMIVPG